MPTTTLPPTQLEVHYCHAAQEYLRKLPLEHFMESTPHATQRKITLESLDLVHARRPAVQVFSELLVQYPRPRKKKPGQVVPDNMVVIHSEPIKAIGSYDLPMQPVGPFCMLEYVSKSSKRKDYVDNKRMYEDELKVPYYLIFDPETLKLTLFHHTGEAFAAVKPDERGHFAIKELDLSMAVLDGWVRFWFQGELLPLPAELQKSLDETRQQLDKVRKQLGAAEAENARLRAQLQDLQTRAPKSP